MTPTAQQIDAFPQERASETEAGRALLAAWRHWGMLQAVLRLGYIEDTRKRTTLKQAS